MAVLHPTTHAQHERFPMNDSTKLAELLCTRLCHDLTGPIGAVNNGAEFLNEEGFGMQNEAAELILSSAQEAVNRLQFYRQAYGRVNDAGEVDLNEKKEITASFFSASKITLDWPDTHTDAAGISFSQRTGKILMNLILITSQTLIRGGTLQVRLEETRTGEKSITITAIGEHLKIDQDVTAILKGAFQGKLSPKLAQAYLTFQLLEESSSRVKFQQDAEQFAIKLTQQSVQSLHTNATTN